jgi:hypothetical protein
VRFSVFETRVLSPKEDIGAALAKAALDARNAI